MGIHGKQIGSYEVGTKDPTLDNYKLLLSAVIEQAVKDYMGFDYRKGLELVNADLTGEQEAKLRGRARSYMDAVRFFKSPQYEYYIGTIGLDLPGDALMAELDRQKLEKKSRKKHKRAKAV